MIYKRVYFYFYSAESSEHQWNAISLCDGSVGTDDATVLHLGVESSAPEVRCIYVIRRGISFILFPFSGCGVSARQACQN